MISALKNLIRFQIKPVSFSEIREAFAPEKIVQGRILQQLNKGLFVLRTQGMNLVAEATVPLQVGDFVTTRVKRRQGRIELKLLTVNGRSVESEQNIPVPDFRYTGVPLPNALFGKTGRLEIYDFTRDEKQTEKEPEGVLRFQLVLETEKGGFLLLKVFRASEQNFYKLYATDPVFYENLLAHSKELFQWFLEEENRSEAVQILHRSESHLFERTRENSERQRLNLRV